MKKKQFAISAIALTLLLLLQTVAGCSFDLKNPDDPSSNRQKDVYCYEETETGGSGTPISVIGSSWRIICGDDATDDEKTYGAYGLYNAIYEQIGKSVRVMSDYKNEAQKNEILIGKTNRAESGEIPSLTYFDYGWKFVNGKFLIYGGSGEALENAVNRLLEKYCDQTAKTLSIPEDTVFLATYSYPYSDVTIGGRKLEEYSIVTYEGSEASANTVFKGFGRQTGICLPISVLKKNAEIPSGSIISVGLETAPNLQTGYRVEGQSLVFLTNGGKDFAADFENAIEDFFGKQFPRVSAVTALHLTDAVKGEFDLSMDEMSYIDDKYLTVLDNAFEATEREILTTASEYAVTGSGKIYYVSPDGNDGNDGLSEATAWKTLEKVNSASIAAGSVVLLRRGGEWNREYLSLKNGVTYSAWGTGEKPVISNYVAANSTSDWVSVANGVWVYNGSYVSTGDVSHPKYNIPGTYLASLNRSGDSDDVGNIVLTRADGSVGFGVKVTTDSVSGTTVAIGSVNNGFGTVSRGKLNYTGPESLTSDGEFYHDPNNSRLYFCCKGGNPATVYSDLKLVLYGYLIGGESTNVTVDNIACKYTGAHGISIGSATNFTIRNCVFEWIGGSIQAYDYGSRSYPTRFGNAIQNWGSCNGFYTLHCYFNQIYDAAWTSQISQNPGASSCKMNDMVVADCAFENHVYGIEIWSRGTEAQNASGNFYMKGLDVHDCYFRGNGKGIGMTRSDKGVSGAFWCSMACPNSTVPIQNCKFTGNTVWDCAESAVGGLTLNATKGFLIEENLFVLHYGDKFAYAAKDFNGWSTMTDWDAIYYAFDKDNVKKLFENGLLGENTYSFSY